MCVHRNVKQASVILECSELSGTMSIDGMAHSSLALQGDVHFAHVHANTMQALLKTTASRLQSSLRSHTPERRRRGRTKRRRRHPRRSNGKGKFPKYALYCTCVRISQGETLGHIKALWPLQLVKKGKFRLRIPAQSALQRRLNQPDSPGAVLLTISQLRRQAPEIKPHFFFFRRKIGAAISKSPV